MITRALVSQARRRSRQASASNPWLRVHVSSQSSNASERNTVSSFMMGSKRFYNLDRILQHALSENKDMAPYIRTCLSGIGDVSYEQNSGFHVWFLGTGGNLPSLSRMTTATMLQLGGQSFLFDAGEGLQRQIMQTRQRHTDITKIFITHMHCDHVLGLPSILLMAKTAGSDRGSPHDIEVYGPPGIYNFIATTFALTRCGLSGVRVVVHELVGGDADELLRKRIGDENMIFGHFPHLLDFKALTRKEIPRNQDGTWTIQVAPKRDSKLAADVDRGSNRPMNIYAAEVNHTESVQTFGYVVAEPEPTQKINVEKATELGVAPGKKYRKLKNGHSVMSDDGIRQIKPEQVLIGANRKVRKLAIIGDNCSLSPAMEKLCVDSDVLVHEAVESIQNEKDAHERGHSSAEMAGRAAARVNASVLAMNHISGSVRLEDLVGLIRKAEEANGGVSHVVPSFDFMELVVPRFGFPSEHRKTSALDHNPQYHSGAAL